MRWVIDGRAQLRFRGRRMLCALTRDGDTVWATFLGDSFGHPWMYLDSCPSLDHKASTIDVYDIDYSSVAEDLGILVTPANFKERALCVWSFRGPMELKTWDVLEGLEEGMWNNPVDLTCDDGYDDFGDIPVKKEAVAESEIAIEDDSDAAIAEDDLDASMAEDDLGTDIAEEDSDAAVAEDDSDTAIAEDYCDASIEDDRDADIVEDDCDAAIAQAEDSEDSDESDTSSSEDADSTDSNACPLYFEDGILEEVLRARDEYGKDFINTHLKSFT